MSIESGPQHSSTSPSSAETAAPDSYREANTDPTLESYLSDNEAYAYSHEATEGQITPEEMAASETLRNASNLQDAVRSQIQQDSRLNRTDKIMNFKDRSTKKALLYDQRDSARRWKASRLELKLTKARARNPNSNKTKQLQRKLDWQRMMLGNLRKKSASINSQINGRGERRENIQSTTEAAQQLKKRLRKAAEEAKQEQLRRLTVRREAHSPKNSEARRQQLKTEIRSWDKNTLAKFYQERVEKALEEFRRREKFEISNAINTLGDAVEDHGL